MFILPNTKIVTEVLCSCSIGRRPVYYMTLAIVVVGRCLSVFSAHNVVFYMAATLMGSLSSTAVFQAPLVIAMEISDENSHAYVAMLQCIGWTFAMCLLPFAMWLLGNWQYFTLATTLPCLVFFFGYRSVLINNHVYSKLINVTIGLIQ